MSNIYFTSKGHTKKIKEEGVWPIWATKHLSSTPKEFVDSLLGLVVLIDPALIEKRYYKATFTVYDPRKVTYYQYGDNRESAQMWQAVVLHGELDKEALNMHSRGHNMTSQTIEEKRIFWGSREEALKLLEEAITVFFHYYK